MRALRHYFREGLLGLVGGWRTSLPALVTIVAAVFVVGALLLAASTLSRVLAAWGDAAEMSVFLDDDVSADERRAIEHALGSNPDVAASTYVGRAEAASRFTRQFPELAGLAASLDRSPFPASYEVRLRPLGGVPIDSDRLARSLAALEGVVDVRYDRSLIGRITDATRVGERVALVVAAVLVFAAVLAVASVVRLSYVGRHEEVEILLLVGAPFSAIRGPFLAEGWLQGTLGALVGLGALGVGFSMFRARYGQVVASALGLDQITFLSGWTLVVITLASGLVGAVAALLAVGRPTLKLD